jgi:hypothetical protein
MNMKLLTIFGIFLFLVPFVDAVISVEIDIKDEFMPGESINFDYTFTSDSDVEVLYTTYVECPNLYHPFLIGESASLISGIPLTKNYVNVEIDSDVKPQKCLASVEMQSPEFHIESEEFKIVNLEKIELVPLICKDSSCETQARVHFLGDKVYFSYVSDIQNIEIDSYVTNSYGNREKVSVPGEYSPQEKGNYDLELVITSEGYKETEYKTKFAVIAEEPDIKQAEFSGQELPPTELKKSYWGYWLIGIIVIVVVVIVFVIKSKSQEVFVSQQRRQ